MKWKVTTLLRDGVKGTEEEVVKEALLQLGYKEITSCKMGLLLLLNLQDGVSQEVQKKKVEEIIKIVKIASIFILFFWANGC